MFQLSRVSWIFLLVPSLSHASGSDSEIKKELKIVWSLSAAICVQRSVFEKIRNIGRPLNDLAAYRSEEKQLCSYITRTNCAVEYSDCQRKFECKDSVGLSGPRTGSNIIVRMKSQQKCEGLSAPCNNKIGCSVTMSKRAFQINSVVDSLRSHAAETQASVLNILKSGNLKSALSIEPLWITNEIVVKGASLGEVQEMLKGNNDVRQVRLERLFEIPEWTPDARDLPGHISGDDWHTKAVLADRVWAEGVTGKGIIVGHLDRGVLFTHEALKKNWRGEYGWFDPQTKTQEPYDETGHGTHTLGIAVGQTKGIGAAPGATWMACKSSVTGNFSETALKTCAQWILCPTKADGTDPDCSKAPHVVNSSWGDYVATNESDILFQAEFEEMIRCWRSAGIIPVFAAGNLGPQCGTSSWPALLDNVISVGSVTKNLDPNLDGPFIASIFTSRGPPHPRYAQVVFPDVSAPGRDILSASFRGEQEYVLKSGTSMSAPLVTGTIALMLEKNPSFNYDQVLNALVKSCSPISNNGSPEPCGNISTDTYPNNIVGFGLINAYKAVFGAEDRNVDCQD